MPRAGAARHFVLTSKASNPAPSTPTVSVRPYSTGLLDDGMSVHRLQHALQRDFHLDLSDGFLSDCLDWKVRQTDLPAYRQWTLQNFSALSASTNCIWGTGRCCWPPTHSEIFPWPFALVSANDQDHMARFLNNLRQHGFWPHVVVTDGSNLYPKLLARTLAQCPPPTVCLSCPQRHQRSACSTPCDDSDANWHNDADANDGGDDRTSPNNEPGLAAGRPARSKPTSSGSIAISS